MRRIAPLTVLARPARCARHGRAPPCATWSRGAGFGHGIGMSQYGAYGFAQKGAEYERILAHYYRGTRLSSAPERPVRVLLQPVIRTSACAAPPASAGARSKPEPHLRARSARAGGIVVTTAAGQAGGARSARPLRFARRAIRCGCWGPRSTA